MWVWDGVGNKQHRYRWGFGKIFRSGMGLGIKYVGTVVVIT